MQVSKVSCVSINLGDNMLIFDIPWGVNVIII